MLFLIFVIKNLKFAILFDKKIILIYNFRKNMEANMVSQINKIILKSLNSGDKYGLEIIKDIQDFTNNRVNLKQPSLYSALRRMEKKGLINSFWEDSAIGGRRHYYSLTQSGREELQADNVLSESDIQSILNEVNGIDQDNSHNFPDVQSVNSKNEVEFEKFDPREDYVSTNSFAQQMRKHNEPISIQEKTVVRENNEIDKISKITPSHSNSETHNIFWREAVKRESQIENEGNDEQEFKLNDENRPSRFEINYKDILGDLDADRLSEKSEPTPTPIVTKKDEQNEQKERAKAYSSQLSQFFSSNKDNQEQKTTITREQEELRNAIFKRQNSDAVEEISRRYNLSTNESTSNQEKAKFSNNEFSNFTRVTPNEIEIKKYDPNTKLDNLGSREFLNINKLILTRSMIITFLFVMAVLISYFAFDAENFIYLPHKILYWIAIGIAIVYLVIMLATTLTHFNKKIHIKKINFFINLFYRALISVALFTFIIALCLCFGMTNFMQIEFFTIWYLSTLAIMSILISWLIGYIIYSSKAFRE